MNTDTSYNGMIKGWFMCVAGGIASARMALNTIVPSAPTQQVGIPYPVRIPNPAG